LLPNLKYSFLLSVCKILKCVCVPNTTRSKSIFLINVYYQSDIVAPSSYTHAYVVNTTRSDSIFVINVNVILSGCSSVASAGQKIRAEYANILVYIIACTMLITIFSD
jgi:hypothetical protein